MTNGLRREDNLRQLYDLYVEEKYLRGRIRNVQKIRATLLTTAVLVMGLAIFSPLIIDSYVYPFLTNGPFGGYSGSIIYSLTNTPVVFVTMATLSLLIIAVHIASTRVFRIVRLKAEVDTTIAKRSAMLTSYDIKTADYIQRVRVDMLGYQDNSRRLRTVSNVLQIAVILGSLLSATLAAIDSGVPYAKVTAVSSGAIASFAASMSSFFKFRERSLSLTQAGTSIDSELNAYDLNAGRYRRIANPDESAAELVEAIEAVRMELRQREAALGTDSAK